MPLPKILTTDHKGRELAQNNLGLWVLLMPVSWKTWFSKPRSNKYITGQILLHKGGT